MCLQYAQAFSFVKSYLGREQVRTLSIRSALGAPH
jgi:hypothetical protein